MRARAGLAQCLWALGRWEEAIDYFYQVIRINPDDNEGFRYLLTTTVKGDELSTYRCPAKQGG